MEAHTDAPVIWDYSRFTEEQDLGSTELCVDASRLRLWCEVFDRPRPADKISASLLINLMMEAYLNVAQPRPPGNIHAGQKLHLSGRAPRAGEVLTITTRVAKKEERKGRKWLTFESRIAAGDEALLKGEILTIWAE